MNLHMPQDPESEAELKNLAAVPYQIISPANNASIIGIYQDSMLGSYMFSKEGIKFNARQAMNLLMMFNGINEEELLKDLQKEGGISNYDILSQIMPPLSIKNKIEIRNGKYIKGQMDKGVLGGRSKGLLQRVCNDFGNMSSAKFIDDLQNVVTEYMKNAGFSVGISDLISNQNTNDEIIKVITNKKSEVKNLIDQVQLGVFENNTGKTNEEEFETQVNSILNQATSEAGKIGLKNLSEGNRFVEMVKAGSKGSDLNISFMISCLGQQNVDGKRIPYGFEHRTLPHFTKYDDSPNARGFVESSYINGLSPQELFMHAMGGRVGLIDTAVKTSTTGYIQRRLIKALEDLMVNYDMTIRTNKNKIVQFSYGDDGIDTTKVEDQEMPIVEMSSQDIYNHYLIPEESGKVKTLSNIFLKNTMTRLKKQQVEFATKMSELVENMIKIRSTIVKNVFKNKSDKVVNCPVAFNYIINTIQGQCGITSSTLVDITPLEAYQIIQSYFDKLKTNYYSPPTDLFKTLYFYYLSPKELLVVKRFNHNSLLLLLDTIVLNYKRAIVTPGEMVGMIAGQSIGEVSTQMTLNSVVFETPIIVRNSEGHIQKVMIGKFIEEHISTSQKKEYYEDKDTTYAELHNYYEIPSCDEDGNIVWKRVEAVTKHPVVNKDGTNTMLKITTKEEREVIATKAKSFLKLVNGKIIQINGDELKVGDYLPASMSKIDYTESQYLSLREILPPTEYVYSSEIEKAKSVMNEQRWWYNHSGKTFVVPHKRSDTLVAKLSNRLRNGCETKTHFAPDCVYTLQSNMNNYTIPEKIELSYNFGYLLGAYAAEGYMTRHQLSIANNDTEYFAPILELCKEWNITTKVYKNVNKNQSGWTSQDLRIYSTLLCNLLEKLCGKLSHNKFIDDKIIFSNKQCVLGFLDAYIGGDGTINKKEHIISASSVSKDLLIDVQQMLSTLGVSSFIKTYKKRDSNNRGTLPENIHQLFQINITGSQLKQLVPQLNIRLKHKQESAQKLLQHNYRYVINKNAEIIPNEIDGDIVIESRNNNYVGVLFDQIKSIEEVPNSTNYAYDLTVEGTRNFNIYNGLAIADTFHFAGVASKSNVTRGVPRIEEILSLSSEIKNPSLSVYLKPEDERQKEKARTIMYMLEHTKLEEIVKSTEICFDPDELNSLIAEDRDCIEQYKAFENLVNECNETNLESGENEKSKWIVRMVMDPEIMLEKNITMDDVNFTLKSCYEDQISCVYSDFNSDKLVFRIRMNDVLKSGNSRGGQKKTKVNPLDQSDQIYILKNFQEQLLQKVVLRGIQGINKVILRKVLDNVVEINGVYKKQDIWVLDTIGTNLLEVLGLDYIDNTRTVSNDIVEIYNVLGIEAARQAIYNELVDVVEFDGTYINYHNYSVLVDRMTFTHKLISIFRHGINNDNIGPIAKASFEETPEMFLKAARHAELDTLRGVSANVMCGQEGHFGTAAFQVVLDINEMMKLEAASEYKYVDADEEIEKFFGDVENPLDPCGPNKIAIQNNVVTIKAENMGSDNSYNPGF
jgi:DNA-directed RNA polymerase beta' subunit